MVSITLYPFEAAIDARPIPVLPEVGSMITDPSFNLPSFSAASIIALAIRSFTLPAGLKYSSFTSTLAYKSLSFSILTSSTNGVFPTKPVLPLYILAINNPPIIINIYSYLFDRFIIIHFKVNVKLFLTNQY